MARLRPALAGRFSQAATGAPLARPAVALLLALGSLGAVGAVGAAPAHACSGAPAVLAADLEAHLGPIVVARVVERNGRPPGPRAITLAVEESLRGAGPDLITLERPRQAAGVCHDAFTVWRNARLLVAFELRPLAGGGPLMPAWTVRRDGSLGRIYDDPPYPSLDDARSALAATQPRETRAELPVETGPVALTLLAGVAVLVAAAAAGARSRPDPRVAATRRDPRIEARLAVRR